MPEDQPVEEPFAVQEIWLDGFSGVHITGENLRCTAFSMHGNQAVAVVKLIMNVQTARQFCSYAQTTLTEHRLKGARNRRKPL